MRLLNYQDIQKQEVSVLNTTMNDRLRGVGKNFPLIIEVLLMLIYYTGKHKNIESVDGGYFSYCWEQYYLTPYTMNACFLLLSRGYYAESAILLRRVLEVLVKMKYLQKHKEEVEKVWLNRKDAPRIKRMFEEVCPNYYDEIYGKPLSGFVHGGASASLFKRDLAKRQVDTGLVYNEDGAAYIVNQFIVYALGYFNLFPTLFSEGFAQVDQKKKLQYLQAKQWCLEAISAHKKSRPKSIEWYRLAEQLL